jgi:predicted XRE-type DNA-binding protein
MSVIRLEKYLKDFRMSQKEFAESIGVTRQYVCNLVAGGEYYVANGELIAMQPNSVVIDGVAYRKVRKI